MEAIIRAPVIAAAPRQLRRGVSATDAQGQIKPLPGQNPPQNQAQNQAQNEAQNQAQNQRQNPPKLAQPGATSFISTAASTPAPSPNFGNRPAAPVPDESAKVYETALAQLAIEQQQQQSAQNLILQKQREAELVQAKTAAEHLGYAQGVRQGEQAAQKKLAEQLARLHTLATQIQAARQEVVNGAEDIIIDLAFTALCRMLGESLDQRAMVTGMVQQVLSQFRQQEPLVVLLHPQDLALLQAALPDLDIDPEQTRFRADASLKMGGCMVESAVGTLDARLETRLACLREALLQVRRGEEYAGEGL
jgi:flagellar assembly protein FliH